MRKFTVLLFLLLFTVTPTYAADSTPSAGVQSKLDQLKMEIASRAAKLKEEINRKLQNKAYVGVIKQKSDTTLTLATESGTKIININQDTVYEPSTLTSKKAAGMKEEDFIAALGDVDETGVLTARKIIRPTTTPASITILWGTVVSISDDILTLKNAEGRSFAISITKVSTEVEVDQTIIVTGTTGKNDILNARSIFITSKPKPSPSVTPIEATKSASPSAKKK